MSVIRGSVKSKIIWLGLFVVVGGYVQANKETLAPFIPPKYFGLLDMALGAALIVARFFTTQSLAEKGTETNEPQQ